MHSEYTTMLMLHIHMSLDRNRHSVTDYDVSSLTEAI